MTPRDCRATTLRAHPASVAGPTRLTPLDHLYDPCLNLPVVRGGVTLLPFCVAIEVAPSDAVEFRVADAQMVETAAFAPDVCCADPQRPVRERCSLACGIFDYGATWEALPASTSAHH